VKSSAKAAIILLVIGLGIFGYSQYASAQKIGVIITQSELLEETEKGATYNIQLEFDNPSLLVLTAGETDFTVYLDGQRRGDGTLSPFTLSPLSKTTVDGTFQTASKLQSDKEVPEVKITGVTTYDVWFSSIDVPFVYYPTDEQAREFIDSN